jgi:Ca2+-binding RTX toxin-like protein
MPLFTLTHSADTFPGPGQNNSGDDTIVALSGRDLVYGGNGNDSIDGGSDADTLYGGAGNDTINAGILPGQEVMDGGDGDDVAVVRYENVINVGTQFSVRVVAVYSTSPFTIQVDGFPGASLSNFEHIYITSGDNDDSLVGGGGDDYLVSLGGNDVLRGGAGDDQITKTFGFYNLLDGGTGLDTLTVLNTDDGEGDEGLVFDARPAVGTIASGGITTGTFQHFEVYEVEGTEKADTIFLGNRDDRAFGLGGNDTIYGRNGNDDIVGGDGNDALYGGDGDDVIDGDAGNDVIYGGDGRDGLNGGTGNDLVDGGEGDDDILSGAHTLTTAADADTLRGGAGDDIIFVDLPGSGTQTPITFAGALYDGGADDDILEFEAGLAVLDLTGARIEGIETLAFGTADGFGMMIRATQLDALTNLSTGGFVQIVGRSAVTLSGYTLTGTEGFLLANGGQSFDATLATQGSSDILGRIAGGTGHDTITGSGLRDFIEGGAGNDQIIGNGAGLGGDTLLGGDGNDTITAGASPDAIDGGAGNDVILAGGGNDTVFGDAGADSIDGGAGNDRLFGEAGRDTLTGGAGRDTFVFLSTADSGATPNSADIITDFTVVAATGTAFTDRIDLSAIDASTSSAGNQAFLFRGTLAFNGEGQVRVRQLGADTVVEVNTTGVNGAEMMIRLAGVTAASLEAADFIL